MATEPGWKKKYNKKNNTMPLLSDVLDAGIPFTSYARSRKNHFRKFTKSHFFLMKTHFSMMQRAANSYKL